MPFVPIRPSYFDSSSWTVTTATKQFNGSWSVQTTSSTTNRVFEWATKAGSAGPRVPIASGTWRPVRGYARRATRTTVLGGTATWGNAPTRDACTRIVSEVGYPSNGPSTPYTICPLGPAYSEGLLGSSGEPLLSTNLRNQIIAECRVKLGDRQVNLGEALAEGRKTIDHLASTVIDLLKIYSAIRRGNIKRAFELAGISRRPVLDGGTAAKRWLEFQYAWKPLVNDIYDTAKVFQNGLKAKPQLVSKVRKLEFAAPYNFSGAYANMKGEISVIHRCKLWYTPNVTSLNYLHQLGLINPLEVAWAIMPYSFVLDWLMPIGTLLEASSATIGLTFVDGMISSVSTVKADGRHKANPGSATFLLSGGFDYAFDHKYHTRIKVSDLAFPYFKSPFSTTRVTSALALLRQLRRP